MHKIWICFIKKKLFRVAVAVGRTILDSFQTHKTFTHVIAIGQNVLQFSRVLLENCFEKLSFMCMSKQDIGKSKLIPKLLQASIPEQRTKLSMHSTFYQYWKECLGKHSNLCDCAIENSSCLYYCSKTTHDTDMPRFCAETTRLQSLLDSLLRLELGTRQNTI